MQNELGVSLRAACYAQGRAEPEGVSAHSGNARSRILTRPQTRPGAKGAALAR
jgi:hypothetical protein